MWEFILHFTARQQRSFKLDHTHAAVVYVVSFLIFVGLDNRDTGKVIENNSGD